MYNVYIMYRYVAPVMALSYERLDLIAAQDGGGCVCVYTLCVICCSSVAALLQLCCRSDSSAGWWRVRVCVYVIIRQHTSAYVSIRQHTAAYVTSSTYLHR